jgi:hypothetical protein
MLNIRALPIYLRQTTATINIKGLLHLKTVKITSNQTPCAKNVPIVLPYDFGMTNDRSS